MSHRVFVTGGSGFVGARLLETLARSGWSVVALDRAGRLKPPAHADVRIVRGDLRDGQSWKHELAGCDLVIHMGASTGRAPAEEHHGVNAAATEALIALSRAAGVRRFLFVSSIAVSFPDLSGYHYAQAKAKAEEAVRKSGMDFLIIRPTIILGPGAAILRSLSALATAPVAILPGRGRNRVAPIHVDDVAAAIVSAAEAPAFGNRTVDLGGPEAVSFEELMRRIRAAMRGTRGPLLRLPLSLFQIPIRAAEIVGLDRLLPVSTGQLASFRFDGVATETAELVPQGRLPLADMLGRDEHSSGGELNAECAHFTRYLTGRDATPYVQQKYREGHERRAALIARTAFDGFLVGFAKKSRLFTRLADAYAALASPRATLRRKLVLLVAILETCPPYYRQLDEPPSEGPAGSFLKLCGTGVGAILAILAGVIVLLPVHSVMSLRARRNGGVRVA